MPTVTRPARIGDTVAYDLSVGDSVTVSTENTEGLTGTVQERSDSPLEEGQQAEVLAKLPDDDVVALYARVMRMTEMRAKYDLYAVRITEDDSEDLGEITEVEVAE